jgi:hypothetical protein
MCCWRPGLQLSVFVEGFCVGCVLCRSACKPELLCRAAGCCVNAVRHSVSAARTSCVATLSCRHAWVSGVCAQAADTVVVAAGTESVNREQFWVQACPFCVLHLFWAICACEQPCNCRCTSCNIPATSFLDCWEGLRHCDAARACAHVVSQTVGFRQPLHAPEQQELLAWASCRQCSELSQSLQKYEALVNVHSARKIPTDLITVILPAPPQHARLSPCHTCMQAAG